MPPDPRDWLLEGHLAWFVLGSVEQLDLAAFYASYRLDGWGRAAFEPQMMVPLLWYAYARGERSSRGIERGCVEDVAYRVIAAHQAPDHATIARFRVRHEQSPADLFTEVLSLCKEPGLVKVGVIAIDGTKVHANASHHCNLDYEQSRARSSSRPPRSTRPRTSCSATPAAMSCRPSFGPRASCASACARPSSAWTPSARRSRSRSRAHARNACGKPRSALSRSSSSSAVCGLTIGRGGRVGSAPMGAGSEAVSRSSSRCSSSPGGRSTRPILIRATLRPRAVTRRVTTRRPS
jgi:transposase